MGQDRSTVSDFGSIIIIKTADRQRCADYCQNHISSNINTWAAEQKTCPNFSCGGDSKLSTGDSIGVGPTTISTTNQPWCQSKDPASACCAPITSEDIYSQFQFPPVGTEPHPFSVVFTANNTALNDKMNAFATLAGLVKTGCKPSSVVYSITNTVTGAVLGTITATYSGSGAPTVISNPTNMTGLIPNANPAVPYKINAHAGCGGYTADTCRDHGFIQTFGFSTYKTTAGSASAVTRY